MTEFFVNVWNGIVANKDVIITALTSAEFATLAAMLIGIWKNHRTNKTNTTINTELSGQLKSTNEELKSTNEFMQVLATNNSNTVDSLERVHSDIAISTERELLLIKKIDAMLEALRLVYSTIKDDSVRTTVSNLLTSAIHSETIQMAELKKQFAELKEQVSEKAAAVKEQVEVGIKKAESIMSVNDISEPIMRS